MWTELLLSFLILSVLRFGIELLILRPIARCFVQGPLATKVSTEWVKSIYYIVSSIAGVHILRNAEWFEMFNIAKLFLGAYKEISTEERIYYIIQTSFYIHLLFAFFCYEEHGKRNYWDMLVHHIITLFATASSMYCGAHRIGIVILVLHDIPDIFGGLSKSSNLIHFFPGAAIGLVMLIVSWFILRLCYFPYVIIKGAAMPGYEQVQLGTYNPTVFYLTILTLVTLWCLHVYWWTCFVRILRDAVSSNECGDKYLSETTVRDNTGKLACEKE
eukprot:gnl/Trimastix_PCT/3801.p1 GENE.gnl/Trimastix_PCT/3801~~gnl/Trimastix_PCT/3801.p1  ORF type:complete len:284 (+),score=60.30 gnl/Trimastix_PCT/3801:35-853(+)